MRSYSELRKYMSGLGVSDTARLKVLRMMGLGWVDFDPDKEINGRARIAEHAEFESAADGTMAVVVWQRDCDCCEFESLDWIPATVRAYQKLWDDTAKGAEGPFSLSPLTLHEAAEYVQPRTRDRILEARENGNYYSV